MLIGDLAICIRAVDYSETSQVVTFFARKHGKIGLIAKGSKRPKSPLDGPIEVFSSGHVMFTDPHRTKLGTLTEFQQDPQPGRLAENLFTWYCCLLAAELVDKLTDDADPHPALFDHFLQFVHNVNDEQAGPADRRHVLAWLVLFQLALLKEIGLRPVLDRCANCKTAFSPAWRHTYFSSSANGLICQDCEAAFADKIRLTREAATSLAGIKNISRSSYDTLVQIEKTLLSHFTDLLHRPPKMAKYILSQVD